MSDYVLHIRILDRILSRLGVVILRMRMPHVHRVRVVCHVLSLQHRRVDLVDRQVVTAIIWRHLMGLRNIVALRNHVHRRRTSILRHLWHGRAHRRWRWWSVMISLLSPSLERTAMIVVVQRQGVGHGRHVVGAMAIDKVRGGSQCWLNRWRLL